MDIDLILESIFETYKAKCIEAGRNEIVVEKHLDEVRDEVEARVRDSLDRFIGSPVNAQTLYTVRSVLNQHLNQFLDTDVKIDDVTSDGSTITVNMSYRPKYPMNILKLGSVSASAGNPAQDVISHSL